MPRFLFNSRLFQGIRGSLIATGGAILADDTELSGNDHERIYRGLRLIRRVDEVIAEIYPSDKVRSPVHLSIGQESVAVGVCDVLAPDDVVATTYRSHAAYLAKGGSLNAMMAELFGKATGTAAGKGGSMHLVSMEQFVLGASAVVGTNLPIAVGYAMALRRKDAGRVVACFFGDGATEEGVFYESLNFAALRSLPVLFVCENNGYAIHQPLARRWATPDLGARVRSFGIPAERITDGDVFSIRAAAAQAVSAMRRAPHGPAFLECATYRWHEHVGPNEDFDAGYRSRDEARIWFENDPVVSAGRTLSAATRSKIDSAIEAEIEDAVRYAEASPFPETSELATHVYAD